MSRFPLLTKLAAIGLVVLLLVAVLGSIDGLVRERRLRQAQAAASVEQSLAGAQTLLGPLLHRQCTEEWDAYTGEGRDRVHTVERRTSTLVATPDTLQAGGNVRAEARHRGLFKVNGYAGSIVLDARWTDLAAVQPPPPRAGVRQQCGPMLLMLAVGDVRGLRSAQVLLDGDAAVVRPGTLHPRHPAGLHAEVTAAQAAQAADARRPLAARVTLDLLGTTTLALVPAAQATTWQLKSDWPHPSFGGRFLPATRDVGASGFDARWNVSALASGAAGAARGDGVLCTWQPQPGYEGADAMLAVEAAAAAPASPAACLDTLAVSFIDPVNPYVLADRAIKYALLFIVLTFGCVALTELLSGRRVHPVQYALVGLAMALFYLLLLSLSEHLSFATAYCAASAGCVALLGYYAGYVLGRWRAGVAFGAGVAVLYGALWALLQMEQTALVIGALLLFACLAAVMVLTRRVDWYALSAGMRGAQADGTAEAGAPPLTSVGTASASP